MRSLVLSCSLLLAACGFNPGGDGVSDDGGGGGDGGAEVDACVATTETCEGTDQDCDGLIDEGFTSGAPCDGPDTDVCLDDMTVCNAAGQEVCGNTSNDDDAELCNGTDDDCDGAMDEGFPIGAQCDGADGDVCLEGTNACAQDGLGVVCSDNTGTTTEICNGADEDCDGTNDNGFNLQTDTNNCGTCNHACTNNLGSTACVSAGCVPACNNGAANCDGNPDNGCELQNTDPQCVNGSSASADATITGDVTDAANAQTFNGTTERIIHIRFRETLVSDEDVTGGLVLTSGAGTHFNLFVYCPSCNATPLSDNDNAIEVGREDAPSSDRGFDVYVEVRIDASQPSTSCAAWTLVATGHVATANRCGGN